MPFKQLHQLIPDIKAKNVTLLSELLEGHYGYEG